MPASPQQPTFVGTPLLLPRRHRRLNASNLAPASARRPRLRTTTVTASAAGPSAPPPPTSSPSPPSPPPPSPPPPPPPPSSDNKGMVVGRVKLPPRFPPSNVVLDTPLTAALYAVISGASDADAALRPVLAPDVRWESGLFDVSSRDEAVSLLSSFMGFAIDPTLAIYNVQNDYYDGDVKPAAAGPPGTDDATAGSSDEREKKKGRFEWTLSFVWPLPWRPRIAFSGATVFARDAAGAVASVVDDWAVGPLGVLRQTLPSPTDVAWLWPTPHAERERGSTRVLRRRGACRLERLAARTEVRVRARVRWWESQYAYAFPTMPKDAYEGSLRRREVYSAVSPVCLRVVREPVYDVQAEDRREARWEKKAAKEEEERKRIVESVKARNEAKSKAKQEEREAEENEEEIVKAEDKQAEEKNDDNDDDDDDIIDQELQALARSNTSDEDDDEDENDENAGEAEIMFAAPGAHVGSARVLLPEPGNEHVTLQESPTRVLAVIRFNAVPLREKVVEQKAKLEKWLQEEGLLEASEEVGWDEVWVRSFDAKVGFNSNGLIAIAGQGRLPMLPTVGEVFVDVTERYEQQQQQQQQR